MLFAIALLAVYKAARLPLKRAGKMTTTAKHEIDRFLRTGDHDPCFRAWRGGVVEAARRGTAELKAALTAEVRRRADGAPLPREVGGIDVAGLARKKVAPMVRGLFPRREQEAVLGVLERSVVFLTPANIAEVLNEAVWLHTAWDLANLYLASIGADLLAGDAPRLVGLSEETTCYVSLEYFRARDRFADFVVHEAAHVFHNCKRRNRACGDTDEGVVARDRVPQARDVRVRVRGVQELGRGPMPNNETVDGNEYLDILREAVAARNGWKRILARCAPPRRQSR